jgi:hypothetical protein
MAESSQRVLMRKISDIWSTSLRGAFLHSQDMSALRMRSHEWPRSHAPAGGLVLWEMAR